MTKYDVTFRRLGDFVKPEFSFTSVRRIIATDDTKSLADVIQDYLTTAKNCAYVQVVITNVPRSKIKDPAAQEIAAEREALKELDEKMAGVTGPEIPRHYDIPRQLVLVVGGKSSFFSTSGPNAIYGPFYSYEAAKEFVKEYNIKDIYSIKPLDREPVDRTLERGLGDA